MKLSAINSLWGKDCHQDDKGNIFIEGKPLTAAENKAIDAEIIKLSNIALVNNHNKPILEKIAKLDVKRIRPIAEGNAAYLAPLNKQIAALRATLLK